MPGDWNISFRVGKRIRELRKSMDLTQQEVADRMRSHRPIVCRDERGKHELSLDKVYRYAEAIGVEVTDIVCVLDDEWCKWAGWSPWRID